MGLTLPLSSNDVESELSYAYLHAIAAAADCGCTVAGRIPDGMGVDAWIHVGDHFPALGYRKFTIEVQLKATATPMTLVRNRFAYSIPIEQYDKLRMTGGESTTLLVVLQLPALRAAWCRSSPRSLAIQQAAYWLSLYGAPDSPNTTTQTVYIPKSNRFTPEGLKALFPTIVGGGKIHYVP
ncbi:DUF4365 domain-containing protein [Caulifigura coniformis]